MELRQLVEMMLAAGAFTGIVNNPMAQFGPQSKRYLGPTLLPEQNRQSNFYKETSIMYRSPIANAATRYSPPQLKGNALMGTMSVELAESDIASEFTSQDYDALMVMLDQVGAVTNLQQVPPPAMTSLLRWVDLTINRPLLEFNELCRWQAIVNAQVQLRGDNNYTEDVNYSDPVGHRFAAGGLWSDNAYDPYDDIIAGYKKLTSKGYRPNRFITSLDVLMILLNNAKVKERLGLLVMGGGFGITAVAGIASLQQLNARLAADGLPPIETYDVQYQTTTGSGFFLPRGVFVMVATTGRDEEVYIPQIDKIQTVTNTLGYVGIGRPANRTVPGRAVVVEYNDKKAAPVTAQGWQTSLPVLTSPEAIVVINSIA